MRIIADFHLHSKYSRATSKDMDLPHISEWAKYKGIDLIGTGDFTHPLWLGQIKQELLEDGSGLLSRKDNPPAGGGPKFILTGEVSSIYTQGGKGRRVHTIIFVPDIATAQKINEKLTGIGNLYSDGRPILGLSAKDLAKIILNINPESMIIPAHCLLPDTYLNVNQGIKKIQNIKKGDLVFTHTGNWERVKEVIVRKYKGKILQISPYNFRIGLETTREHPFYAIKTSKKCPSTNGFCRQTCSVKESCGRKFFKNYHPQWVQAKDLETSDIIIYPRSTFTKEVSNITASKFVKNYKLIIKDGANYLSPNAGRKDLLVKDNVKVDKDFCRLMGYYIAEGYTNSRDCVSFCFHKEEVDYIKDILSIMRKSFGVPVSKKRIGKESKSIELIYYSKILVQIFENLFYLKNLPKNAHSKLLPDWALNLPHEKQAEILKGWWRGDKGYTVSRYLMNQMKTIMLRLGIIPSIREWTQAQQEKNVHKIGNRDIKPLSSIFTFLNLSFYEDKFNLPEDEVFKKYGTKLNRRHGWIDEKYIYLPIKDIHSRIYHGEVYNLEVEKDNSYTSEFATIHNCWTPWFSIFGSNSGFDSIEECYEELANNIKAIETGLSSDPEMNWRLSALDKITLISNSDAHSPANLGREANVFELENITYDEIADIIKTKDPKRFLYTIEFYPEEGKYHFDGHRNCDVVANPFETKYENNICPKCGKKLTIGVMNRVEELADRPVGYTNEKFPGSKHLVPLREIIGESFGVAPNSQKVQNEYLNLVNRAGSEFKILLDMNDEEMSKSINPKIIDGIKRVRAGDIDVEPGYDGVYGKVKVFEDEKEPVKQSSLF